MSAEKEAQGQSSHADNMHEAPAVDTDSVSPGSDGLEHQATVVYWKSFRFLGSLVAIMLMANSLFIGYAMPVNVLSVIDADIGRSFFSPHFLSLPFPNK